MIMRNTILLILSLTILLIISLACQPQRVVRVPTPTPSPTPVTCAHLDAAWGRDWPTTLLVLKQLQRVGTQCGEEPLSRKKYAAHFSYAQSLETNGYREAAIGQYQAALLLDSQRTEALHALMRLDGLPPPTPVACESVTISPASPPMAVDLSEFVYAVGDKLYQNGEPFIVRGVNYYPRYAPWHRFLESADMADIETELALLEEAGFNTIRVFLRYEPLFTCQPEQAIPDEAAFRWLDRLFEVAGQHNLHLLVTLNDLPDLAFRPLYTDWAHYDAQTTYIVRRYRHLPHILAWDVRNEGDLDYGISDNHQTYASREEVLQWLAHVSELVRRHDPHHLLTAGWFADPVETAPHVDLLSFHHWTTAEDLQTRLDNYRQRTDKPLLLQEVGYTSWGQPQPNNSQALLWQAQLLGEAVRTAEAEGMAGWLVWTAFDFSPRPGQPKNHEHFYGLWTLDLTPKPSLGVLPLE